ncbi:hypothetical protein Tco_0820625, partial [Tanacetum coccineum]
KQGLNGYLILTYLANPNPNGHSNRNFVPLVMYDDDDLDRILPSRMAVPAGSVVPTGKDNSIVSTGSTKVIPAGRTILFLTMGTNDDEVKSSQSKRSRHETVEEVFLPQVHHEFLLWEGCNRDAKSRMGYGGEIDDMLRIRVREAESDEQIFTSVAWIRVFNINEPTYAKLFYEFYSTYKFDEVCVDDELHTKKIIKFRLGGRAHSLTLLEFARRLGLYQAVELEEDGFNVHFEGGLRNDDNFNAQDYWLSISREDNLGRLGMIRVLTEDVVRSLSALIYCKDLDTTTLRDLIDSDGKLIPEDPQTGVPTVGIPRPLRASMQDLYDSIVFGHMARVYSVPMQGAYNPPGYAQPQYDQYYQQYLPPPPQYQEQQQDDNE